MRSPYHAVKRVNPSVQSSQHGGSARLSGRRQVLRSTENLTPPVTNRSKRAGPSHAGYEPAVLPPVEELLSGPSSQFVRFTNLVFNKKDLLMTEKKGS